MCVSVFLRIHICTCVGAIPNFATEKEQKRNFLDFTDVTLVVVDKESQKVRKKYVFTAGLV